MAPQSGLVLYLSAIVAAINGKSNDGDRCQTIDIAAGT
jgi:hypothetical protein